MKGLLNRFFLLILLPLILNSYWVFAAEVEPAVARVSFIAGEVSTMRGDSGDWTAAAVNAPLVRGDKITTGSKARVEIQLDYANVLRVAGQSNVTLADLDQNHIQIQISDGLINYTVFNGSQAEVEINTPNVAIRPVKEGVYRIEVNDRSETELIIRKGEAEVSTIRGSQLVKKGQTMMVRGSDDPLFQISEAPDKDSWDDWNSDRDNVVKDAKSYRYANNYYTGIQDMDRYGEWTHVPGYDWVWSPMVDDYWAPYRSGRWVWEAYWGWTWCSYEPWGWAPYHYGRWFSQQNHWYWWPGPCNSYYRPMWAPAYVSFIGFGFGGQNRHFGFGFGYNSIGWMPVGPGDYYHPWWGHRNSYHGVDVTNITNVRNVYNNYNGQSIGPLADGRRYPRMSNIERMTTDPNLQRGVTSVSSEDFARGRGAGYQRGVQTGQFKDAQLLSGTVPVVPTKESLKVTDSPARLTTSSMRAEASQRYFTRRDPPASLPSFQSQAAAVQQMVQSGNPASGSARSEMTERARVRSDNGGAAPVGAGNSGKTVQSGVPSQSIQSVDGNASDRRGVNRSNPSVEMRNGTTFSSQSAPQSVVPQTNSDSRRDRWRTFGTDSGNSPVVSAPASGNNGTVQAPSRRMETPSSSARERTVRGSTAVSNQPAANRVGMPAQTQRTAPAEKDRSGWSRFGSSDRNGSTVPSSSTPSVKSNSESRQVERFSSQPSSGGNDRSWSSPRSTVQSPRSIERSVSPRQQNRFESAPSSNSRQSRDRFSSRSESIPAYRGQSRPEPSYSQSPVYERSRTEAPQYQPRAIEPQRVERPQLRIERTVVTERSAPRNSGGGYQAPRSAAPSAPSHSSSDRGGGRGQSRR